MFLRIVSQPFVHFLFLGGLIFVAYNVFEPSNSETDRDAEERIQIDQQQVDHLVGLWKLQWKREPADKDLHAIVDRHIRQEVFYREAIRLGLDNNDEIIRKRLAQKMEAVAEDLAALIQPATEQELKEFFHANSERFQLPQAYEFRQVLFLADDASDESKMADVKEFLQSGGEIPGSRIRKLSLPNEWNLTSVDRIENAFGGGFSQALDSLPLQQWSGPIGSGYGQHLVFIKNRKQPRMPDFESVREYVVREYEYQSELKTQDRVYRELLQKYQVNITADVPDELRKAFGPR